MISGLMKFCVACYINISLSSSVAVGRSRKFMYIGDFSIEISNASHALSSTYYSPSTIDFSTPCLSLGFLPACWNQLKL